MYVCGVCVHMFLHTRAHMCACFHREKRSVSLTDLRHVSRLGIGGVQITL